MEHNNTHRQLHSGTPRVSVIMGIYNCGKTLESAVESILRQTYTNWELILCDDGSSDNTYELAGKYAEQYPEKIILLRNERNRKLSGTLNRCLEKAGGELIARMDGDDISRPERLGKQVQYLLDHPDVDLVGTQMLRFDETGHTGILKAPLHPVPEMLRGGTPIHHATILTYRSVYDALGGYTDTETVEGVEDVDLWFRFFEQGFTAATLDEALYEVRMDKDALKRRTLRRRLRSIRTRAAGYKRLGFPKRWLIRPACLLIAKGLVPYRIKRWYTVHHTDN